MLRDLIKVFSWGKEKKLERSSTVRGETWHMFVFKKSVDLLHFQSEEGRYGAPGGIRWLDMAFGTGKKLGDCAPHTCGCGCGCFFLSMTDSRRVQIPRIMDICYAYDRSMLIRLMRNEGFSYV